jgi:hypothetical protein
MAAFRLRFFLLLTVLLAAAFVSINLVSARPAAQVGNLPEPFNLSDNEGNSEGAKLALDGDGGLHAIWWDNSSTGRFELMHRQLDADGKWAEAEILTESIEILMMDTQKMLIQPDGQFCVLWEGASDTGDPETLGVYRRCQEDGAWTDIEFIQPSLGGGRDYMPALDPDGKLQFINIVSAGDVMFGDTKLSDDLMTAMSPQFVIDSSGVYHVIFTRQGRPYSVEYRFSSDEGAQWKDPERLTDDNEDPGIAWPTRLVADSVGGLHMVMNLGTGLYYRHWTEKDGWQPAVELTQGGNGSATTSIGLATDADGLAHVVWQGNGLYYTQQEEDGTWTSPEALNEDIGVGPGPEIIVDSEGTRHVVWQSSLDLLDVFYLSF